MRLYYLFFDPFLWIWTKCSPIVYPETTIWVPIMSYSWRLVTQIRYANQCFVRSFQKMKIEKIFFFHRFLTVVLAPLNIFDCCASTLIRIKIAQSDQKGGQKSSVRNDVYDFKTRKYHSFTILKCFWEKKSSTIFLRGKVQIFHPRVLVHLSSRPKNLFNILEVFFAL